jgi:hypothetical protein
MIPEAKDSKKGGKGDAIAEIIKSKDREARRILLWSRRQLHKEALARQLRYSIYEAQWMEALWLPVEGQQADDSKSYQAFFYAGDAKPLRSAWAKLSERKKKELLHFDRGMQQRDLMEALLQAFGYAPRFLAACHSFLTARETYKLTGLCCDVCVHIVPERARPRYVLLTRCTRQRRSNDISSGGPRANPTRGTPWRRTAQCAFPPTSRPY